MEPGIPHTAGACSRARSWGYAGRPLFMEELLFACEGGGEQHAKHAACRDMAGQGSAGLMLPRRLEPTSKLLAAERLACIAEAEAAEGVPPLATWQRIPVRVAGADNSASPKLAPAHASAPAAAAPVAPAGTAPPKLPPAHATAAAPADTQRSAAADVPKLPKPAAASSQPGGAAAPALAPSSAALAGAAAAAQALEPPTAAARAAKSPGAGLLSSPAAQAPMGSLATVSAADCSASPPPQQPAGSSAAALGSAPMDVDAPPEAAGTADQAQGSQAGQEAAAAAAAAVARRMAKPGAPQPPRTGDALTFVLPLICFMSWWLL